MSRDELTTSTGPYCPLDRYREAADGVERFGRADLATRMLELLALHGPTAIRALADRSGLTPAAARATVNGLAADELVRLDGPAVSRDWRLALLTPRGEARLEALRN